MTFSIAARCAQTGRFGVAVASSSPAVAARCAHVRAGVGAVTTQNVTDPRLGPQALGLLARGADAVATVAALRRTAPHPAFRQFSVVDGQGGTAWFSGAETLGVHAVAEGAGVVCAGNLLADPGVPSAMVAAFAAAAGGLAERMLAAMRAGLAAGGEAGPIRSAGLVMADRVAWPVADLRVDWADAPLDGLAALWEVWAPQLDAYVARALDPGGAPAYGVPGNL